jgi:integrase/recombinase XerC
MTATNRTPPPARARPHARRPDWLRAFSTDRATREPSPHTLQAYRQDFDAIAALVVDDPQQIAAPTPPNITKDSIRQAFAAYAESHEGSSIRRCWST